MGDLPLLGIVIVDVWNVAAVIERDGAGKMLDNNSLESAMEAALQGTQLIRVPVV